MKAKLIIILLIGLVFITGCTTPNFYCNSCSRNMDRWDIDCNENCFCQNKTPSYLSDDCIEKWKLIPSYCWIQEKLPEDTIWSLNKSDNTCNFPKCETGWWCNDNEIKEQLKKEKGKQ